MKIIDKNNSFVSAECPSHTYKDTVGNEECKVCAHQLGYGTRNRGAKSITECECLNANCAGSKYMYFINLLCFYSVSWFFFKISTS